MSKGLAQHVFQVNGDHDFHFLPEEMKKGSDVA